MTGAEEVYRRFMDALNRGDLDGAELAVDPARWREECVGFQLFGPLLSVVGVVAAVLLLAIGLVIGLLLS